MEAVSGPLHKYLSVDSLESGKCWVIEPTEFRRIEVTRRGNYVYRNLAGKGIGDNFFSTWDRQRQHGGISAKKDFEEAAHLHSSIRDIKELEDGMKANILSGLMDYAEEKDDLNLKVKIYNKLAELVNSGTKSYLAINNAFSEGLALSEECSKAGMHRVAHILVDYVKGIRAKKGNLIINGEPVEGIVDGKVYLREGKLDEARRTLRAVRSSYSRRGYITGRRAFNQHHAELLIYSAQAEMKAGWMSKIRIYNEMLVPANNLYAALSHRMTAGAIKELEQSDQYKLLNELIDKARK
jgi:hypothetical protein